MNECRSCHRYIAKGLELCWSCNPSKEDDVRRCGTCGAEVMPDIIADLCPTEACREPEAWNAKKERKEREAARREREKEEIIIARLVRDRLEYEEAERWKNLSPAEKVKELFELRTSEELLERRAKRSELLRFRSAYPVDKSKTYGAGKITGEEDCILHLDEETLSMVEPGSYSLVDLHFFRHDSQRAELRSVPSFTEVDNTRRCIRTINDIIRESHQNKINERLQNENL